MFGSSLVVATNSESEFEYADFSSSCAVNSPLCLSRSDNLNIFLSFTTVLEASYGLKAQFSVIVTTAQV